MFTPPRFVVVDDNEKHLAGILDALQALGAPGLGLIYDPETGLDGRHLRNVRALFVDLHLIDSAATTDERRHYGIIAGMLENGISPTGGPFVLVVWTEHDHLIEELREYLDASLDPEKNHARPLAVVGLPKTGFIDLDTGASNEGRADALRDAVESAVSGQPQLAALVAWEADAQAAAAATLSALVDLVPEDARNSTSIADELDEILSRLAQEAVGRPHVADAPRAAVSAALAPILADRIVNQDAPEAALTAWREAVTRGDAELERLDDPARAGKVNRMLHVAVPPSENVRSTDWGTVVEFPDTWWRDDEELQRLFGVTRKRLLGGEYRIERNHRDQCRPRLVRVGAACDHAQKRPGPLLYLFGLDIPTDVERKKDNTGAVRLQASEWSSPVLLLDPEAGPFVLAVNTRYWISVGPAEAGGWEPVYRLREQLLMHLITHAGNHLARPGIVQL